MRLIPLNELPAQNIQVVLDGQYCGLTLRQKGPRIYLDLSADERPVCAGAVCVSGANVLQSPSPHFSGTLHFYDLGGQAAPRWPELGSRYLLLYLSADEEIPDVLRF